VTAQACLDSYLPASTAAQGCRSDNLCALIATTDPALRATYCQRVLGVGGCQ
jgi:hypothetical protein